MGESCLSRRCVFTGCVEDGDCATGKCRAEVYACTECGQSADCPRDRPVCEVGTGTCVQCQTDEECPDFGPPYCAQSSGRCVHCQSDDHCPNGLRCDADGTCAGAPKGAGCPNGVRCSLGLMCVNVGSNQLCLQPCSLYVPDCPTGELCLKLVFQDSNSLVFDQGEPLGICSPPGNGAGYRASCVRSAAGHNCTQNLDCVPDTATTAVCRAFCDPAASTCPPTELCHPFPGDFNGREYGLCYADNGYAERCQKDADCRANLGCGVLDDPTSFEEVGNFCRFSPGAAPALAPCANVRAPDGGLIPPDAVCRSGACRADPVLSTPNFFCYGACATDADCQVGGRSGRCTGSFLFSGTGGVSGNVKGCRPTCDHPARCAEYGANYACRTRVDTSAGSTLTQVCGPSPGPKNLGEGCASDNECRSGYCALEDGRGVLRRGVCLHPCTNAADCQRGDGSLDGGGPVVGNESGVLSCEQVALLGYRGFDGLPNSYDDRHHLTSQCSGAPCVTDADCTGAARCVPVPSPANPLGAHVLRCRPPHRTGTLAAGAACTLDADCQSGACVTLQPPSTGSGRACFQACDGTTPCPGSTSCRPNGARIVTANGSTQNLTSCAP